MKIILTFEDCRKAPINAIAARAFKIVKAVNTTEYPIGDYYFESQVQNLCRKPNVTVNIVGMKK